MGVLFTNEERNEFPKLPNHPIIPTNVGCPPLCRSIVYCLWSAVCGLWSVVCCLWSAVCGLWSVVCCLWSIVCGLLFVVHLTMYRDRKITVVVPCLNEEEGIQQVLARIPKFVD